MGRTARKKQTPHVRPVERITLSDKHIRWRLAGVICLLFLAAGAIGYGLFTSLQTPAGWTEIQVRSDAQMNCSEEFILQYRLGADGGNPGEQLRTLQTLYTEAMEQSYRLFNNDSSFEGTTNIYDINQHPNEILTVDTALYEALQIAAADETRSLYLAPVYRIWDNLFYCQDDSQLYPFDPVQNLEVREEISNTLSYCNDSAQVELTFPGENQVCLQVSESYITYAETELGELNFIDFYWMKNAHIIDLTAKRLQKAGLTAAVLSSYDGFTRNLDTSGEKYRYNLYDRQGNHIYPAAIMEYTEPVAMVFLRNYPMNEQDFHHYYELEDGSIRTAFLDSKDGMCKSSTENLLAYSREAGCGEIAAKLLPIYLTDSFSQEKLKQLAEDGIHTVYGEGSVLKYSEQSLCLIEFYRKDEVCYTAECFE